MSRCYTCGAMHWWLGRNASRRLGGDGPRRQRSGLRATRGPRQRRVCSRGLGLCAMMRTRRHLGWCRRCEVPNEVPNEVPLQHRQIKLALYAFTRVKCGRAWNRLELTEQCWMRFVCTKPPLGTDSWTLTQTTLSDHCVKAVHAACYRMTRRRTPCMSCVCARMHELAPRGRPQSELHYPSVRVERQ